MSSEIRREIISRVTGVPYTPLKTVEIEAGQRVVDANVETYNPETHFVQPNDDKEELVSDPVNDNIEVVAEPGLDPAAQNLDSIETSDSEDPNWLKDFASGGVVEDTRTYLVGETVSDHALPREVAAKFTHILGDEDLDHRALVGNVDEPGRPFYRPETEPPLGKRPTLDDLRRENGEAENPITFTTDELYIIERLVTEKLDAILSSDLARFVNFDSLHSIGGSVRIELRYRGEDID